MISVIMPVYNAEQFLAQSIESILNQTEKNFEFIIVNDGSTDQSEKIISNYTDSRIRYIRKENGGEGSARNTGISAAQGDYIVWQDADDVSLPNRLELLRQQFYSDRIGLVHSDMLLINENGNPINYYHARNIDRKRMLRFFLKVGTPFMIPSSMIRKELFKDFTYQSYKIGADSDFIFKQTLNWETVHIPEPLLLYRRHDRNVTTTTKDYETLFQHMQAFLKRHSIEELVPEIDWTLGETRCNEAKAKALIGLFLFRRGMLVDGKRWVEEAIQIAAEEAETLKFINAIVSIASLQWQQGLVELFRIKKKDHIIYNYLGEIYAAQGDIEKAFKYFIKAIELNPYYIEPVDNLKSLGYVKNLHLVDLSFYKFINH